MNFVLLSSTTSLPFGESRHVLPSSRRHVPPPLHVPHGWCPALLTATALSLGHSLRTHAAELKKNHKSAILLWMSGGPSTMDIWDLKPGASTGGPFKPIATAGDVQICEHMPLTAKVMDKLSIVRSMSTREADHKRGRYYMHTGYVPNPNIEHPSYGAVLSHELIDQRPELEIPPFVSVGGGSVGPGFLGMAWAPFVVNSNGQVRNLDMGMDDKRLIQRMAALDLIEKGFIGQNRGSAADDHMKILKKTLQPDDQRADGSVQGHQGAQGSARPLRQRRLRPRLPDGSPPGRSGRPLRRGRPGWLGQPCQHPQHLLARAASQAAGARPAR